MNENGCQHLAGPFSIWTDDLEKVSTSTCVNINNLQHSVVGPLALHLLHLLLCSVNPFAHFLYLSIQLLHLLLVVLKDTESIYFNLRHVCWVIFISDKLDKSSVFFKLYFVVVSASHQQQVEPFFCSGCDRDPVAAQQADLVVHQAAVAPQHRLQGLRQLHHGLQLRLPLLRLPVDGLTENESSERRDDRKDRYSFLHIQLFLKFCLIIFIVYNFFISIFFGRL